MALHIIGIGLNDEKDVTIKGLELIKKSEKIYLEYYTSLLQCSLEDLENFYGKKINLADRVTTEQGEEVIINEAKEKDVSFLVIGDPMSATTHIELYKLARENNVPVKIVNNASVLNAIGVTGLQLYKFGKTTSIPFIEDHPHLETPYNVLKNNLENGLHTLLLLDLRPKENRFMTVNEALEIMENIEKRKEEKIIHDDLFVVGCARLGNDNFVVKSGKFKDIKEFDFGKPLHCLIIPGKMHFIEEEMLNLWI